MIPGWGSKTRFFLECAKDFMGSKTLTKIQGLFHATVACFSEPSLPCQGQRRDLLECVCVCVCAHCIKELFSCTVVLALAEQSQQPRLFCMTREQAGLCSAAEPGTV
ncbi:UNVERIFIED_CONTAM: hypothetical protein K2H54_046868 [Gekko kuhli]